MYNVLSATTNELTQITSMEKMESRLRYRHIDARRVFCSTLTLQDRFARLDATLQLLFVDMKYLPHLSPLFASPDLEPLLGIFVFHRPWLTHRFYTLCYRVCWYRTHVLPDTI